MSSFNLDFIWLNIHIYNTILLLSETNQIDMNCIIIDVIDEYNVSILYKFLSTLTLESTVANNENIYKKCLIQLK